MSSLDALLSIQWHRNHNAHRTLRPRSPEWKRPMVHPAPAPISHRRPCVTVAVKPSDGKQRRTKHGSDDAVESPRISNDSALPAPPRVDPNLLIPVRRQIAYVNAVKEATRKSSFTQKTPGKLYRKKTQTSEEYRQERTEKEAAAAALSKLVSKNFALRSLYESARRAGARGGMPPVLLVDGYNVLFKWELMRRSNSEREDPPPGDLQDARDELLEALGVYSQSNGIRVVVAFDAMGSPSAAGRGSEEVLLSTGVTCVYCCDQEADSFIEAQVEEWLGRGCPQVVVATSDVAHKAVVDSKATTGRQVCFVVPSSGLIKDMEATKLRLKERLSDLERPNMSLLGSVVKSKDRDAFSAMQKLRLTLPPAPGTWEARKIEARAKRLARGYSSGSGSESSSEEEERN